MVKERTLWLYQYLTRGNRNRLRQQLSATAELPVSILFYHRVADTHANGWTLSCGEFTEHLDWLQDNYDIVSLSEAQRRIHDGKNGNAPSERPAVAITFDDGYSDNSEFAIPELAKRGLSATYFVSTDFVAAGRPFLHDVRAGTPLKPNTVDELKRYRDLGIEIGAHTCSHPDLGSLSNPEIVRHEIEGSVQQLNHWLDIDVRFFAFPFGLPNNTSQLAVDVIRGIGLSGFCTAYGALNWPGNDAFHLRRIHGDSGIQRLKNWLTLDSRKLQDRHSLPFDEAPINYPTLVTSLLA